MKSTVEHLSPTRVRLNVEVPFDELKPNFDRAYKSLAQQVRIPGFRPGKVPAPVLEARIGRGPILDEVVNEAIPSKYSEAVTANEVRTVGRPEIDVTNLEDGQVVEFTAEVDVRPEITVPDFGELAVSVDDAEVTEDDVTGEIDNLRARFATLTGVQRPAQNGDFVVIDLSATVDGQEVEEARTTGFSYEVGAGTLVEGIDEALVGVSEGETTTFTTKLVAGEHAGADAEVEVTVNSVKERELPEVDDEFAQMASEFDTVDELTEDLRTKLGESKRMQQGTQARDRVLDALLEAVEVPLPESLVQSEVESGEHDAVHQFDHDKDKLAEYLQQQGSSLEEFEKDNREAAERSVKTQLLLDTIADQKELSVSDQELTQRILLQAQRMGVSPDQFVQQAQQSNQLGAIYADVRRGKALFEVVREASVTDESGNALNANELFGIEESDEDSEDETPTEVESQIERPDVEQDEATEAESEYRRG